MESMWGLLRLILFVACALAAVISAAPFQDRVYGTLCVFTGETRTKIPVPPGTGPRESGPVSSSPSHCTSCDPGWPTELYTDTHFIQLTDGHVFVLNVTSCDLFQRLELNAKCIPKYIQRSWLHDGRYFVICNDGRFYHQLDYEPSTGQYHLTLYMNGVTSGPAAAIVGGANPNMGTQEDYLVRISGNGLLFTEVSSSHPFYHRLGETDNCATPTAIHPMVPNGLGYPRVIVTCMSADDNTLRYVITAGGTSPTSIEPSGTPALSPLGDYLLVAQSQGFLLYRTRDFSFVPGTYSADVLELRFHQSGAGLFLSVGVAGQNLRLLDVEAFIASGGHNGQVVLNGTDLTCPDDACLPHGLMGAGSTLFSVFVQEQSSYTLLLYSLSDPTLPLMRIPSISGRPNLAILTLLPSPGPTVSQVASTMSSLIVQPSVSLLQPNTPVSPSHSSTSVWPSSSLLLPLASTSVVLTPSPHPSSPPDVTGPHGGGGTDKKESGGSDTLPVWAIAILTVGGAAVCLAIIAIPGIVVYKNRRRKPRLKVINPVIAIHAPHASASLFIAGDYSKRGDSPSEDLPSSGKDSGINSLRVTPHTTPEPPRKDAAQEAAVLLSSARIGDSGERESEIELLSSEPRTTPWTPDPSQPVADLS